MRTMRFLLPICLVLLLLTSPGSGPRAEVNAGSGSSTYCLVVGITEGPDPIPHSGWDPILGQPVDGTALGHEHAVRAGRECPAATAPGTDAQVETVAVHQLAIIVLETK